MLIGILGNLCSSICLSVVSLLLFRFLLSGRARKSSWLRRFLRGSYFLYASLLSWLRPFLGQALAIDLLAPVPRTLASVALSVGIGLVVLMILGLRMPIWLALLLLAHGLFVGLSWRAIAAPDDFQLGTRLE
jgi:hypothetical protein